VPVLDLDLGRLPESHGVIASADQLNQRTTTIYDAAGQAVLRVDPLLRRSTTAYDLACGSRKPRRPAGSKQQGPVVVYGNEPTRRGRSDEAIRRPGGRLTPHPCRSRKPRRPAGSTQQGPVVMYGNEPKRRGCSDEAIRRPGGRSLPGWRSGVARAGGRSSWRTRCGCGDKHRFGPQRPPVKCLDGKWPRSRKPLPQWQLQLGRVFWFSRTLGDEV
jgi:hypothetical protein